MESHEERIQAIRELALEVANNIKVGCGDLMPADHAGAYSDLLRLALDCNVVLLEIESSEPN